MAACAQVLRAPQRAQQVHAGVEGVVYEMDPNRRETYKLLRAAAKGRAAEWAPWGYELEALCEVPGGATLMAPVTRGEQTACARGSMFYMFDWQKAEVDVARARGVREAPVGNHRRASL